METSAAEENSIPTGSGADHKEEDMDIELSNQRCGPPICTQFSSGCTPSRSLLDLAAALDSETVKGVGCEHVV